MAWNKGVFFPSCPELSPCLVDFIFCAGYITTHPEDAWGGQCVLEQRRNDGLTLFYCQRARANMQN